MSSKRVEATLAFMPPKFFTMLPSFMYSPAYFSEAALSLSMSDFMKRSSASPARLMGSLMLSQRRRTCEAVRKRLVRPGKPMIMV